MSLPPSNNMGAEITPLAPEENRILIDWFSWTVKTTDVKEAISLCGLDFIAFSEGKSGGMGYKASMRCGNIVVYHDGTPEMGCHFSITGKGCRQYEGYKNNDLCWYQLILKLTEINANITRLDVAIDNVDGDLDLVQLRQDIKSKDIRSRFKGGHEIQKFTFEETDEKQGRTIYVGSNSSRIKIRFYDKAAQMGLNTHWNRAELQMMGERATAFVEHLIALEDFSKVTISVLNNYFQPIDNDNTNKSRCKVKAWWTNWLKSTQKLPLTVYKSIKIVPEIISYIEQQYAPSIALIHKYLGEHKFTKFVSEIVKTGAKRFTKKHDFILECSNLEPLTDVPF